MSKKKKKKLTKKELARLLAKGRKLRRKIHAESKATLEPTWEEMHFPLGEALGKVRSEP